MNCVSVPDNSEYRCVGYDVLGLALDRLARYSFEASTTKLEIVGDDPDFAHEQNLIYTAFATFAQAVDTPVHNLRITVDSNILCSRGLGSSESCVVGGIAAANEWLLAGWDRTLLLKLAAKMEGHPEHAAPDIFGLLCDKFLADTEPIVRQYPDCTQLQLVTYFPEVAVSTAEARKILLYTMTYADAA